MVGLLVEIFGEAYFSLEDILVDDHRILISEGVDPCVHLVDEYAEGPPVNSLAMALVQQDLGSEVFWGPAQSVGSSLDYLGEAEVSEFEIAVVGNQQVLGFEISENNIFIMQMLENQHDLGSV